MNGALACSGVDAQSVNEQMEQMMWVVLVTSVLKKRRLMSLVKASMPMSDTVSVCERVYVSMCQCLSV